MPPVVQRTPSTLGGVEYLSGWLLGPRPVSTLASTLAVVAVACVALLLRAAVASHPHSGEGQPPMYGDYEAQRHWMEITLHTPTDEWYVNTTTNDLLYWGLDYPPLTAYHALLCGKIAQWVDPDMVALYTSRGYETALSRIFMRATAFFSDAFVFLPAAAYFCFGKGSLVPGFAGKAALFALIMLQPSNIIVDHGHFQYNCVCLGLVLWAVVAYTNHYDCVCAACFTLALSFKQMSLYYALPFFFGLLGRAWASRNPVLHVARVGVTVIATGVFVWLPFLTSVDALLAVLGRLFPWDRGLYEDKVANVWCAVDVVLKLKANYSIAALRRVTLISTLAATLPTCLCVLRKPTARVFLLTLFNGSLAFFLFSYQVHEKSILLPLLPATLLFPVYPEFVTHFSVVALFSMYPLLRREGLGLAYHGLMAIFCLFTYGLARGFRKPHFFERMSLYGMVALHAAQMCIAPPARYPDLFPLVFSVYAAGHFVLALLIGTTLQWQMVFTKDE